MTDKRFILLYVILTVIQIVFNNFFGLSRYVLISVLPVLVLMLPARYGRIAAMLVAFATGFIVDFFSTGMLGITSLALVPVALVGRPITGAAVARQGVAREDITFKRLGIVGMSYSVALVCAIFFFIYIWADAAGTVGFWPCALRFLLSVLASTLVGVLIARQIRPE